MLIEVQLNNKKEKTKLLNLPFPHESKIIWTTDTQIQRNWFPTHIQRNIEHWIDNILIWLNMRAKLNQFSIHSSKINRRNGTKILPEAEKASHKKKIPQRLIVLFRIECSVTGSQCDRWTQWSTKLKLMLAFFCMWFSYEMLCSSLIIIATFPSEWKKSTVTV